MSVAKMFATMLSEHADVGDLVLVEVPPNCTIHDEDAARLEALRHAATALADAVQQGVGWSTLMDLVVAVCRHADQEPTLSRDPDIDAQLIDRDRLIFGTGYGRLMDGELRHIPVTEVFVYKRRP